MKRHLLFVTALVLALVISACKQNPYPEDGQILNKKAEPKTVAKVFSLDLPSYSEFVEGRKYEIPVKVVVPDSGTPQIQFLGLPPGMIFDADKSLLIFDPSFESGNDPVDPKTTQNNYKVRVRIRSSENPSLIEERAILMRVLDIPREFRFLQPTAEDSVEEGQERTAAITVNDEDFPNGPFTLVSNNFPSWASVSQGTSSKQWDIRLNPGYRIATSDQATRTFLLNWAVVNPRGRTIEARASFTVRNKILTPRVHLPDNITSGIKMNLAFSIEEMNGETTPTVSAKLDGVDIPVEVLGGIPGDPMLNPRLDVVIRRDELPLDWIGTRKTLKLNVCRSVGVGCVTKNFAVNFVQTEIPIPVFDRNLWKISQTLLALEGQSKTVSLPVTDPSNFAFDVSFIGDTSWIQNSSWAAGRVTFTPRTPGVKAITLQAKNVRGAKTIEHFTVDVLPASWATFIHLADSSRASEVRETLGLFTAPRVLNPDFPGAMDPRNRAFRKGLIVGTNAIRIPEFDPALTDLSSELRKIFLSL